MRVLLLNQFFHPDLSATAQLATDLAQDLVSAGIEVTALAGRGGYLGGGRLPARELLPAPRPSRSARASPSPRRRAEPVSSGSERAGEGAPVGPAPSHVRIERVRCTSLGKGSIPRRLVDYGTFYAAAAARVLAGRRHDAVVAMSTPPLVATLGAAARGLRGARFVYWLQDVYPELAVEFGLLRARSPAARALDVASRWTLRRADAVVVLGEAMGARVRAKGVDPARVHVIPNWADGEGVRPVPQAENPFRRAHGLDGRRVVLYSGNMGRAHDLATVLAAARRLRDDPTLVFLFVGDGARRPEVEAAARELPAVRVLPYQPREALAASLSAGDVHLVTQEPFTVGLVEPSKLYGVMAAGRPVLYVGPPGTEAAETIRREAIGEVVSNGDVSGAVGALHRLLSDPLPSGRRARAAFERDYARAHRTAAFARLLRALAG